MTYTFYRNKRNKHKVLVVKNDGHSHNYVKQLLVWKDDRGYIVNDYVGFYSRWRKQNLLNLLDDYIQVKGTPLFARQNRL